LAVAEALFTRRVLNLDPGLSAEQRERKIKALKNALRVKEFSIRKSYGVSLRPRGGSKMNVNPPLANDDSGKERELATQSESCEAIPDKRQKSERNHEEIRRKLLEGASYDCRGAKITIHCGLAIHLPRDASPTGIFLKCDLVQEGHLLENPPATDALLQDPAFRLGVEVQYTSSEDGKLTRKWAQCSGIKNAKRANSLVDYLECKSIEFTENQPRRVLRKNLGRGRSGVHFTDDLPETETTTDLQSGI
jgi:hypothetical protein